MVWVCLGVREQAICDARNNNVQLTAGTKGNKEGLFDTFRVLFKEKEPDFAKKTSWKQMTEAQLTAAI